MQIEAGKFYLTRDGRQVGPMVFLGSNETYAWGEEGSGRTWMGNGWYCLGVELGTDLVSEWVPPDPAGEYIADEVNAATIPQTPFRTFTTGATRDLDADKLDFEGFLSPLVLQGYAEYMHGKRKMVDGSLRDSDNWQKGIPLDAYMKSTWRHFKDMWAHHRGYPELTDEDLTDSLYGILFNVMGYLHETLKARRGADQAASAACPF